MLLIIREAIKKELFARHFVQQEFYTQKLQIYGRMSAVYMQLMFFLGFYFLHIRRHPEGEK